MIKQAILAKCSTITDARERGLLFNAYLMLSSYQDLTDAEKEVVVSYKMVMQKPSPEKIVTPEEKIAAVSFMVIAPAFNCLQNRVIKEYDELTLELRKAGLH